MTNDVGDVGDTDTTLQTLEAPSLSRRMACWLYEGMLLFGVIFITGYLFGTLSQTRNALDNRHGLQAFIFLVLGIYFCWFWSKGQTLAMKTWHIRVVNQQGRALSQIQALIRYFLSWVWFLPPIAMANAFDIPAMTILILMVGWIALWAMLSRFQIHGQFWHDAWARTYLIKDERTVVTHPR
ncbi:RDD family protein [Limnohabitans sp. Rim8]|uniref:RDD family protein n=1 Tax=Limnohabitans sp. Rim8 TaxID=1100718 RepID=UPI0033068CA0